MQIVAKAITVLLAVIAAAGLVGNATGSWMGLAPLNTGTALLPLLLWFALGALGGFGAFGIAGAWASPPGKGDWTRRPAAPALANWIVAASFAALFVLAALSRFFYWGRGIAGHHLVPDSAPHTMLFLASAAFAIAIARVTLLQKSEDGEEW
jgi:hypothetical protein